MSLFNVAWTNVVVGVLAGLVVTVAGKAKDYAYDKYLEYQYPIAGKYISRYEEHHTDETARTAPIRLTQQGKNVYGRSKEPYGGREWVLDGEIVENGYLNGIFHTTNPHNTEMGNFFLYVESDGTMRGHWSGSPEKADGISYGSYQFKSILEGYEIEPVEAASAPTVLDLAARHFRDESTPLEGVRDALDDGESFVRVAVLDDNYRTENSRLSRLADRLFNRKIPSALQKEFEELKEGPRVIGFVVGSVVSPEELRTELALDDGTLPVSLRSTDRIGLVRGVAVREEFQHRGVGTALVKSCLRECKRRETTVFCALDRRADSGAVNGILDYLGFERQGTYDGYWSASADDGDCPHCGDDSCECSAVLFTKF